MVKKVLLFIFVLCLIGCIKETQQEIVKKEAADLKGKKILMIIASSNFRDEEYLIPYEIFEKHGAKIITAASSLKISRGMLGAKVKPDILITKVNVDNYDAIVFVGGSGSCEYWNNKTAHNIVQQAVIQDKVLAGICIAPVTFANANVLKDKNATVFFTEARKLKEKGANYTGKDLEIDGKIITANGPQASEKFAQAIVNLLK